MMQYYFPSDPYLTLLSAFVLNVVCALIAYFSLFKVRSLAFLIEKPPVAPFQAIPIAFLSLMVAFMAAAVWQNVATANVAAMNERSALKALQALPLRSAELRGEVDKLLDRYLLLVTTREWGLNFNLSRDEDADAVLNQLVSKAWAMRDPGACGSRNSAGCPSEAAVAAFVLSLEKLEQAREHRLSLGRMQEGAYLGKWELLYLLALATYMGIGAVHRPNPRTARFAITVGCISVTLAFSMISLYIHPYKGPSAIKPSLLDLKAAP
jgi:hypothetical protein